MTTEEQQRAVYTAEIIRNAAKRCGGKRTGSLEGITVHCPDPYLLECANGVLDASEKGEGLEAAIESFYAQLSDSKAEGSRF